MSTKHQSRALLSRISEVRAQLDRITVAPPTTKIDPVEWAEERLGFTLDPWQRTVLAGDTSRMLLVCPRQAGKSTITAALAGYLMVTRPGVRIVILSPTIRQSGLLAAKTADVLRDEAIVTETATRLILSNGSSLDSLPGDQPKTVRGATAEVLIIDEASRVKNELVVAGLPMVAATDGDIVMLTTPAGAVGAFYEFWSDTADDTWQRVFVEAAQVGHYNKETLALMRRRLGERMFNQEFGGRFLEAPGALFASDDIDALFGQRTDPWSAPITRTTGTPYKPLF